MEEYETRTIRKEIGSCSRVVELGHDDLIRAESLHALM